MMSKVMKRTRKLTRRRLPSPPLPSPQPSPQQKQKRKLTNEQGDKQENHECVYTQLTLLVAQFPPNSIFGS